jgi:hypothetical protein
MSHEPTEETAFPEPRLLVSRPVIQQAHGVAEREGLSLAYSRLRRQHVPQKG